MSYSSFKKSLLDKKTKLCFRAHT